MKFAMMGISYQKTQLSLRELCTFSDTKCLSFFDALLSIRIMQAVILSTCNRTEIYYIYDEEQQKADLTSLFLTYTTTDVSPFLFYKEDSEAFSYLLEVSCGYHSMVYGEDQIATQLKHAYEVSCAAGACQKQMHKIFQMCFSAVKNLKAQYAMNHFPISVAYLAMQKLKKEISFEGKTIMIIGSGEMAKLMRTYANTENFKTLYLCNRTLSNLRDIQQENECVIPFEKRYAYISSCDIVCSATASPHIILKEEEIGNHKQPLYLLDLALPRDIEETISKHDFVTLWDMDHLQCDVDENIEQRKKALHKAHPQLLKKAEEIHSWFLQHAYDQAFHTLQQRSEELATQTYELLHHKLHLSSHEEYVLQNVLHTAFLRMIKEPMMQLKQLKKEDKEAYLEMLKTLFKGER